MSNDLTAAQKTDILNGVALAQTAYALNNTPGAILANSPLVYLDDVAAMNQPGYSTLPMSLPAGFTITNTYKTNSGGNFFLATNVQTKEIFVGIAGTNGFLADAKDRNSDVVFQGTNQVLDLFSQTAFRAHVSNIVNGDPSWTVLAAGQSLGGAQAKYIGMALTNGIPGGADQIEGLSASNVKIIAVNGLNVESGLSMMGYEQGQINAFASSASIYNLIGAASVQDKTYLDSITRTGGQDIGQNFTFTSALPGGEAPLAFVHRLNGSWSTYYQNDPGLLDLTPMSMQDRQAMNAQSFYNTLNAVGSKLDSNGNWIGLTMTGYAAIVFSAPGESGAFIGEWIQASTGMDSSSARGLGYLLEAIGKGGSPFMLKFLVTNPLAGAAVLILNAFASSRATEAPPTDLVQAIGVAAPGVSRAYLVDEQGNNLAMDTDLSGRITFRYIDGSTVRGGEGYFAIGKSDGSTAIVNDAGGGTIWLSYNGASVSIPENSRIENYLGNGFKITTNDNGGGKTEILVNANGTTGTTVYDSAGNISSTSSGTLSGIFAPTDPINNTVQIGVNPNPTAGQGQQSGASGETSAVGNNGLLVSQAGVSVSMDGDYVDTSSNGNLADTTAAGVVADSRPGAVDVLAPSPVADAADNLYSPLLGAESAGIVLGTGTQNAFESAVYVDPLVLDLNGDGVRLTDYGSAPVLFDADHDGGSLEQSGWVDVNDGIVVHDLNANGAIDGIHETLSEYYNGTAGTGGNAGTRPFANGIAALKSLDSNADNVFTSADAAWNNLRVWVDADHDAVTDAGELKTFADLGIVSINLAGTNQSGLIRDGNEVLATSTFTQTVGGNTVTREAIAANFLTNPNGHSFTASGAGTVVLTQGGGTGANGAAIGAVSSYVSHSATGETIDVAAKGVQNAYGSVGNDTLTGDANNNWLAGSTGSDTYNAGAGDDVLLIDASDLQANIHAGSGMDIVQVVGDEGVTLNLAQAEVEIAQGGRGNDILIGGGRSSVFVRGGEGDDIVIGGAANDALSGEDGDDLIDGGAGNDVIRGHRGRDVLLGGAGDDLIEGGMEDDSLSGGDGNDALTGGQGDDVIDGGAGTDIAQFSGSFSEYRVTRTDAGVWISDTVSGRDGTDFLKGVEKANFRDVSLVEIPSDTSVGLANPLPVKDVLTKDKNGAALTRGASSFRFTQAQLLGNDVDWQGGALTLNGFSDVQGGTVSIDGSNGDVVFTTAAGFNGIYGFKYTVRDAQNNAAATVTNLSTGATAQMKAAVYLKTTDLPSDPLVTDQWYLTQAGILPVWKDYTGKGVRIGQFEPGGNFSVTKEVLDYRHADLQGNIDSVWLANPTPGQRAGEGSGEKFSTHATVHIGVA